MKKNLFAIASAMCFLISCNNSSTPATTTDAGSVAATTPDSSQSEKNLVNNRRVFKAIETGDSAVINSLIADDAIDHQGPNGTDIKGGDSIRHILADMHNHVKDLKIDITADAANGDYIFALSTMTGTTNDMWMGMPAGTKMEQKGVDVIKVSNGKMVEHWGFADAAAMMKQMKEMSGGKMKK